MDSDSFFETLDDFEFSQDYLKGFVENSIEDESWYVFDCGKHRWTVQEQYGTVRTECTNFKRTAWFKELYHLFKIPINFGDILFTRTPPPGIPPHIDRNRPAAINLPVCGNFSDSPILWYQSFDPKSEVTRFYHSEKSEKTSKNTALLFNPQKIHGVLNEADKSRCLLTLWWRNHSYEEIKKAWNDGSLIDWEVNDRNKLVRVLREPS